MHEHACMFIIYTYDIYAKSIRTVYSDNIHYNIYITQQQQVTSICNDVHITSA